MSVGLRHFAATTTPDAAGAPIIATADGDVLLHSQPAVSIVLDNRAPECPGTLYITSKQVIWLSDEDRSKGYAVDFVSITLHAVSRDPDAYPSPCIYTQIETGIDSDEDEDDDESDPPTTDWSTEISKVKEMRLVPSDPSQLETLFEVFCEGAELNPEPMEEQDEEEHNWVFSADQLDANTLAVDDSEWSPAQSNSIGHSNGGHDLADNVLQLQINDQRFEDAEETEDVENGSRQ